METKWLKEALFSGMTSNAFKLGTILSLGWFWTRVSGCCIIYKGQDGDIDDDRIQAVMNSDQEQIAIPGQVLEPGIVWHYIRRAVSHCGLESADSPPCIIIADAAGDVAGAIPNSPINLTLELLSNARFKLLWRYTKIQQEIEPTGFRIYMDSGLGFNFENPDAEVPYFRGKKLEFSWTSDPLVHGQFYKFVVRAYKDGAGESLNINYVSGQADSLGPNAIDGLIGSWAEQ